MVQTLEKQAAADLATAKAQSDRMMAPIFGALGIDASLIRCTECGQPIHGKPLPGQTHRECFAALDGPYDDRDQDAEESES